MAKNPLTGQALKKLSQTDYDTIVELADSISQTELDYLDGATAGTQVASKAVVADANVNIGAVKATELHIGATGSEVQISATPAEIDRAADKSTTVVDATAATLAVTAALHGSRIVTLNRAAGVTVTLPAATGTGEKYTFIIGTTATSNANIIQVANATDVMDGSLVHQADSDADGTVKTYFAAAGDDTLTFAGAATTGGIVGNRIECIDYAAGFWSVTAWTQSGGGAEVTPFSAAVS